MANKPLPSNPVADIPQNWTDGQIVAPSGTDVGLTSKHGWNYIMSKINEALIALGLINDSFANLADSSSVTQEVKGAVNGTAGSLAKFTAANKVGAGPALGNSTTTFLRNDGSWAAPTGTTYAAGSVPANTSIAANGSVKNVYDALKAYSSTGTLSASGWDSNNQQTVTISNLSGKSVVIVSPAPSSVEAYTKAGVYCSGQSGNVLTFTCKTKPSEALTVQVGAFI